MAAFSTTLNVSIRAHGGGSWKGCEPQLAMHVYLEAPGSPVRFASALVGWARPDEKWNKSKHIKRFVQGCNMEALVKRVKASHLELFLMSICFHFFFSAC